VIEQRRAREISTVAYHAIDRLVFVRVPNERGRYMLTDQCVALVGCSQCGACVGEPCANRHLNWYRKHPSLPLRYTVSTHVAGAKRHPRSTATAGCRRRRCGSRPRMS
jgi:hypothetical protein